MKASALVALQHAHPSPVRFRSRGVTLALELSAMQGRPPEMTAYPSAFAVVLATAPDGSVRVTVQGELDLSTAPELDETLRREIHAGRRIVVDLSEIEFIDSTGLNTLIGALRASDTNGGTLAVSPALPAQVRRVLEITGLIKVLPLADE